MVTTLSKVAVAIFSTFHSVDAFVLPISSIRRTNPFWYTSENHDAVLDQHRSTLRTVTATTLWYLRQPESDTSERDFYSVLGISRSASDSEIKGAYRKLAKLYHPDANPNRDTTEQFQLLNRAYEVLRDPALKQAYDMFGKKGIGTSAASDVDNVARRHSRPSQKNRPSEWTYSSTNASQSSDEDRAKYWQSRQKNTADPSTAAKNGASKEWGVKSPYNDNNNDRFGAHTQQRRPGPVDPGFSGPVNTQSSRRTRNSPSPTAKQDTFPVDPSVAGRGSNFDSWKTSSSTSSKTNNQNTRRAYQSGPKSHNAGAYNGDMGSVHTQPRTRPSFEDSLFIPRDGSPFTNGEAFFGRGPKFGRDVLVDVEVDATTANLGGKKSINIKHMTTCNKCKGMGTQDASSTVSTCRHCGGAGHTIGVSQLLETCKSCHGTGRAISNPCKCCRGLGLEQTTKSLDIVVPKKLEDGYSLRIPGEGDAGPNGGPAGDLYVCFKISTAKAESTKNSNKEGKEDLTSEPTIGSTQNTPSKENLKAKPLAIEPSAINIAKPPILTATASPSAKVPVSIQEPNMILEVKAPSPNNEQMKPAPVDVIKEQPTRIRRRDRIGGFFGGIVSNLLSK